jgi:hypothetical protein
MRVATRERLPNRREAETFDVEAGGLRYRATIGRCADGRLAEIFPVNHKAGSQAEYRLNVALSRRLCAKRGRPLSRYSRRQNSHRRPSYDAIFHSHLAPGLR